MTKTRPLAAGKPAGAKQPFTEAEAWDAIGAGWRPLFGSFRKLGFSFEWHDFESARELDWARSFHPGSIELCLNLAGTGTLADGQRRVELEARTLTFYHQGEPPLAATRRAGERHQFITVEFSPVFLQEHLQDEEDNLHPLIRAVVGGAGKRSQISAPDRLGSALAPLVESLRHPPVFARAQAVWFQGKALELAAHLFFHSPGGELFCTRQQRAARERVERVRTILREKLSEPPPLEELGRLAGCSPFYLSRLFSQEVGLTIQQYLRQIRMERAAELLRAGKCNVTEAALEVGYSSLSHFSATFHQTFGCCPGLYPLKTPTQAKADEPA
jgi:AraC-like DNA-binding protein